MASDTRAPTVGARRRTSPALPWVLALVAATALASLLVWGASPYARYLGHDNQPESMAGQLVAVATFLVGWGLMILAMMLPTATRLLRHVGSLTREPRTAIRLQVITGAGFVLAWLLVGNLFRTGDVFVHMGVESIAWLDARPQLVAAGVLAVAGLFQFTSLKRRCLTACRSPQSFLYRHWRGHGARDALWVGTSYGFSCVGCCWALMLVMFGLGTISVPWMLGVGLAMAVEKNTPFGPRLSTPIGLFLLAAAGWVAAVG